MSFFIQPQVLRAGAHPITEVAYMDPKCQLAHKDIFVGDNTFALLLHLQDGEYVHDFYNYVLQFYDTFVAKQLKAFDFVSKILPSLAFLDPRRSQSMPQSTSA